MPRYRVIIYGDNRSPRHSDFLEAQVLLNALRAAIPDFDLSQLSLNPLDEGNGSIVFTGDMDLDKWQLTILGLG